MYMVNAINFSLFILIVVIIVVSTLLVYKNTDQVNHIYLINLKRRPDRLKDFLDSYNQCGLTQKQLTKFNGVDGSVLDIQTVPLTSLAILELKQLETIGFRYKHYQLTKGAIGCFLSHVKVWEHILSSEKNCALIFEDDARPPPNFKRMVNKTMRIVPDDWDIVLFGKHCYDCEDKGKYLKVNKFILLHSYMISKRGILKIFNENNLFPEAVVPTTVSGTNPFDAATDEDGQAHRSTTHGVDRAMPARGVRSSEGRVLETGCLRHPAGAGPGGRQTAGGRGRRLIVCGRLAARHLQSPGVGGEASARARVLVQHCLCVRHLLVLHGQHGGGGPAEARDHAGARGPHRRYRQLFAERGARPRRGGVVHAADLATRATGHPLIAFELCALTCEWVPYAIRHPAPGMRQNPEKHNQL